MKRILFAVFLLLFLANAHAAVELDANSDGRIDVSKGGVPAGTDGQIVEYVGTTPTAVTPTAITAGTALSFNAVTGTLDLDDTAVALGTCTNCDLRIDQQGRVTAKANGSGGSFAFDTFPEYEDSAHTSGIAVNATTVAFYITAANKWLTASLTDSLDPTPAASNETLLPTADHVHQWDSTGANGWSQIADSSDSTYISTSTNFEVDTPTLANTIDCAGKTITSVSTTIRAWSITTGGAVRIALLEKAVGGTSVYLNTAGSASDITLNTSPTDYTVTLTTTPSGWTDNPSTTWTCAIIDAFEAGVRSYSVVGKDARVSEVSVQVNYE